MGSGRALWHGPQNTGFGGDVDAGLMGQWRLPERFQMKSWEVGLLVIDSESLQAAAHRTMHGTRGMKLQLQA